MSGQIDTSVKKKVSEEYKTGKPEVKSSGKDEGRMGQVSTRIQKKEKAAKLEKSVATSELRTT